MSSPPHNIIIIANIKDASLKSLLAAKLMAAHSQGIHVHIEINEDIQEMPVKMIDLIRVLGIFLTNVIEAAEESEEKELDLAMIRESDQTAILIRNTTKPLSLSQSKPPLQVVVWVGPHKGRLHARPKGRVSQALLLVRL